MSSPLVGLMALGAIAVAFGCNAPRPDSQLRWPAAPPSVSEWRHHRDALASLRRGHTRGRSYTMRLSLELREPVTGQSLRARGAVAVAPEARAFRMILLGPGGTTALDLWSCADEFRFAVPAADLVARGSARSHADAERGLPVGFLRWWLIEPLAGRLLYAARLGEIGRFVLSRDGAVLDVEQHVRGHLVVERRTRADTERVESTGTDCPSVRYVQRSTGLDIRVTCEGLDLERPVTDAALADPDDPTRACHRDARSAP